MKKTTAYLIETDPVDHKTNQWTLQGHDPAHREVLAELHTKQNRAFCQGLNCKLAGDRPVGWNTAYEELFWNTTALVDNGDGCVFLVCEECFEFLMPKPVEPYVAPVWTSA